MKLIFRSSIFLFLLSISAISTVSIAEAATIGKPSNYLSLNSGLVGWYTLDGKDVNWTTGTVVDRSGLGNTGLISNMSTTTTPFLGKIGQALKFDGGNDAIRVPRNSTVNNMANVSVSFWMNVKRQASNCASTQSYVVNKDNSGGNGWSISIPGLSCRLYFFADFDGATNLDKYSSTNSVTKNTWEFWVITWDGSASATNVHIYKNGIEDTGGTGNADGAGARVSDSTRDIYIGNWAGLNSSPDAIIDDVRIYNRVLSLDEIRLLYNLGSSKFDVSRIGTDNLRGLVGWWTMDGKDVNWATGRITDKSGQGNTGLMLGMSTTTTPFLGKIGQALNFDGTNDGINVGSANVLDNLTAMTVSVWIKPGANGDVVSKDQNNPYGWRFYIDASRRLGFTFARASGSASITTSQALDIDKWSHIAVSMDYPQTPLARIYINGAEAQYLSQNSGNGDRTSDVNSVVYIGVRCPSCGTPFYVKAGLDDVRIYNRAFSADEIRQLYNQTVQSRISATPKTSLTSGLVGHWTFDGKDVNWATGRVIDKSGQGNTGIISGMATSTGVANGKFGQAMKFDGVNDYVKPSGSTLNNVWAGGGTASFWVNLENEGAGGLGIWLAKGWGLSARQTTGTATGINFTAPWSVTGGVWRLAAGAIPITFNSWHHLVFSYNSDSTSNDPIVYLDGVQYTLSEIVAPDGVYSDDTGSLFIIGNNEIVNRGTDGIMDDIRLYDRILTFDEVKTLYRAGR